VTDLPKSCRPSPSFLLAASTKQSDTPYQLVYFAEDESDRVLFCSSNEDAITVHPTDATWKCKD